MKLFLKSLKFGKTTRLGFGLGLILSTQVFAAKTYTIGELIDLSLKNSTSVASAQAQADQAKSATHLSRSYALPVIGIQMTASQTDDALQGFGMKVMQRSASFADFGAGEFNPAAGTAGLAVQPHQLNYPGRQNDFGSSLYMQVPLFAGGQLVSARTLASAAVQATSQGVLWQKDQARFDLLKARAQLMGAEAYVNVALEAEKTYLELVKTIEKTNKEGLTQKSDLLSAKLKLADARIQKQQAQDMREAALDQIKTSAGIALNEEITVNTEWSPREASLTCSNLERNQALLALKNQGLMKDANIQIQKAGLWPTVGAIAKLDAHNPDHPSTDAWSYTVGIQADWKIFEGGQRLAQISSAKAEKREWQAQYNAAQNKMQVTCRESERQIQSANAKIKSKNEAIQNAEEAMRLVNSRYKEGLSTLVEWQGIMTQLENAKAEKVAASLELEMQKTALLFLNGDLSSQP